MSHSYVFPIHKWEAGARVAAVAAVATVKLRFAKKTQIQATHFPLPLDWCGENDLPHLSGVVEQSCHTFTVFRDYSFFSPFFLLIYILHTLKTNRLRFRQHDKLTCCSGALLPSWRGALLDALRLAEDRWCADALTSVWLGVLWWWLLEFLHRRIRGGSSGGVSPDPSVPSGSAVAACECCGPL